MGKLAESKERRVNTDKKQGTLSSESTNGTTQIEILLAQIKEISYLRTD